MFVYKIYLVGRSKLMPNRLFGPKEFGSSTAAFIL